MSESLAIFYSWQSDLPKETNQIAIRSALREAADQLEIADSTGQLKLDVDEATRGAAGSPNIPQLILNKIDVCDIFVCDVTTINTQSLPGRPVANPNVLVELGYAIATIGWARIILVFNEHHGKFPNDLPFDIDRHRATRFTITDRKDKSGKAALAKVLQDALQAIITQSPHKPFAIRQLNSEQVKRAADIRAISSVLQTIYIPNFDIFLEEFPDRIIHSIFYFKEAFLNIVESSTFFLYDQGLLTRVAALKKNWVKSLSYAKYYFPDADRKYYKYHIPGDEFPSEQSRIDFIRLSKHRILLQNNLRSLISYIRLSYLEIDVDMLSEKAYQGYLAANENP